MRHEGTYGTMMHFKAPNFFQQASGVAYGYGGINQWSGYLRKGIQCFSFLFISMEFGWNDDCYLCISEARNGKRSSTSWIMSIVDHSCVGKEVRRRYCNVKN